MKKLLFSLFALTAMISNAQTSSNYDRSTSITCDSVNTLYGYTYLNHGAMFNVVASADITLDHLTANIKNGTFNYRIYYKVGSFLGFETDAGAWTLIDSAVVTSVNNGSTISNQPTVIPINLNLPMQVGDTIAIYMMAQVLSSVYLTTTTIPWATEYSSNASLSISVARSVYQLFGTPFSTPQIWNGTVAYCEAGSVGVSDISGNTGIDFNAHLSGRNLEIRLEEKVLNENPNLEFQITDILGKDLVHERLNSSVTNLNISRLTPGIYICSIRSNTKVLAVKKVFVN